MEENKLLGLSNSLFDEPFKKVIDIKKRYSEAVIEESKGEAKNLEKLLFEILNTNINFEPEKTLEEEASVFVRPYWERKRLNIPGTQSQIVLTVDKENNFKLHEVFHSLVLPTIDLPVPYLKPVNENKLIKVVHQCVRLVREKNKGFVKTRQQETEFVGKIGE